MVAMVRSHRRRLRRGRTRGSAGCRRRLRRAGAPFSQLALLFVLFTYGGWNDAAYISAEVRDPRRNMVRALLIGIVIVTVLYVLVNLAYLKGLGLDGMTPRMRSRRTS